jgi:hypothetical protein
MTVRMTTGYKGDHYYSIFYVENETWATYKVRKVQPKVVILQCCNDMAREAAFRAELIKAVPDLADAEFVQFEPDYK